MREREREREREKVVKNRNFERENTITIDKQRDTEYNSKLEFWVLKFGLDTRNFNCIH